MAATTQFFSLDSPSILNAAKQPTDQPIRDHYGFEVPTDYQDLYCLYYPVWEREETQRESAWFEWLTAQAAETTDHGKFTSLDDLCDTYLHDLVTITRANESLPQRRKLDELVKQGVPFTIRGKIWSVFLDTSVRKKRGYYKDNVQRCLGPLRERGALELDEIREQAAHASAALQDSASHGFADYAAPTQKALETWCTHSKVWLTQIEKDLPRTFPGLKLMDTSGRPALRRVLAAYSLHNSTVGYCQGLNFVAGTLLLFLDEEDAFWCLAALLEDILKGYYDMDMMGMQVDQRVFKRLVLEHFPALAARLEEMGADVSCVFVQWFLCVFVNFLPIEACLRVWDALFYYRSPTVLFKTALALLEVFRPALDAAGDVLDALDLLQSMAPLTYASSRLLDTAFGPAFEGVTDTRLRTLRAECREMVRAEAEALAEEMAWEGSAARDPPPPAPQQQQRAQQQHQPSKMSVLKSLARDLKEKFVGGGGNAGSGADSVERAASPALDPAMSAIVASSVLSGGGGAGGGGGSAGTLAQPVPLPAASAGGGAVEEPLLVRAPQRSEGGTHADGDSEDYHPYGNTDEAYEQVSYVAPSEVAEAGGDAAAAAPGAGAAAGSKSGGGNSVGDLLLLGEASPPKPTLVPAQLGLLSQGLGVAGTPAPQDAAVAMQCLEPPQATAANGAPAAAAPACGAGGVARGRSRSSVDFSSGPSYVWHETPKWTSIRMLSSAGQQSMAVSRQPGGEGAAAAAGAIGTGLSPQSAAEAKVPPGQLSPQVLMLAAGRTQSNSLAARLAGTDEGAEGEEDLPRPLQLSFCVATSPRRQQQQQQAQQEQVAGDAGLLGATAQGSDPLNAGNTCSKEGGEAPAPGAQLKSHGSASTWTGAETADFSEVQAADQARRAQGAGGKRRSSKAAVAAWEIAMAPLKQRCSPHPPSVAGQSNGLGQSGGVARQLTVNGVKPGSASAGSLGPMARGALPAQQPGAPTMPAPGAGGPVTGPKSSPSAPGVQPGCNPQRPRQASGSSGSNPLSGSQPPVAVAVPSLAPATQGQGSAGAGLQLAPAPSGQGAAPAAAGSAMGGSGMLASTNSGGVQMPGRQLQGGSVGSAAPHTVATPAAPIPALHGRGRPGGAAHALGDGGGSGAAALALFGSSVNSNASLMIVDEHREASPAEARDEWVIMASPAADPRRSGPHSRVGMLAAPSYAMDEPGTLDPGVLISPPDVSVGSSGSPSTALRWAGPGAGMVRHGSIGLPVPAGRASAGGWAAGAARPADPAPRTESTRFDAALEQHNHLQNRLSALMTSSARPAPAAAADAQADVPGAPGSGGAPRSVGSVGVPTGPSAAAGEAAATQLDPVALSVPLERLHHLQRLLTALHAGAQGTGAAPATQAAGATATAGQPPGLPSKTGSCPSLSGLVASPLDAKVPPSGSSLTAALQQPLPPAPLPFGQVVVGPGGQVMLQPAAPEAAPPPAAALLPSVEGAVAGDAVAAQQQAAGGSAASDVGVPAASAAGAADGEGVRSALRMCAALHDDLRISQRRADEAVQLAEAFGAVAQELAALVSDALDRAAESQRTSDQLGRQLGTVMERLQSMDDQIAERDSTIQYLKDQLPASAGGGPAGHGGAAGAGGGGGGGPHLSGLAGLAPRLGVGAWGQPQHPASNASSGGAAHGGGHQPLPHRTSTGHVGWSHGGPVIGFNSGGGGGGGGGGSNGFGGRSGSPVRGASGSSADGGDQSWLGKIRKFGGKLSGRDSEGD